MYHYRPEGFEHVNRAVFNSSLRDVVYHSMIAQAVQMARVEEQIAPYDRAYDKSNWTSVILSGIITPFVLRITKYACQEVGNCSHVG